ncbi:TPA: hypothetical protein KQG29_001553 [Clostridioides difficile]|nr:hypothetical protein [Clostridioides difficile]
MNELQIKKDLVIKTLEDFKMIDLFEIDNIENGNTTVFKSIQNLEQSQGIIFLAINETVYSTATIYFATLKDVAKKEKILNLMNDLNIEYKGSKYFINNGNEIGVQIEYIADARSFNAELFINVFKTKINRLLESHYSEFMKII